MARTQIIAELLSLPEEQQLERLTKLVRQADAWSFLQYNIKRECGQKMNFEDVLAACVKFSKESRGAE